MRGRKKSLILGLILIALGLSQCGIYNQMVEQSEEVSKAWSEVENQLQRRNDLIPNYVETVKGYASHEREIFTQVAEARSKLAGTQKLEEKMKASNELTLALGRLLMIVERYPDLKANQNFIQLQDELAGTENRIAVARMRYNEAVKNYNAFIKKFPQLVIARIFKFEPKPYFEAPESAKAVPAVKF